MIDRLIASDLAALALEDQQKIASFALPAPQQKPRRRLVTWPVIVAMAPAVTMLALGFAFVTFDLAPFGFYERFLAPFIVAIASLVGLVLADRPRTELAWKRQELAYALAGTTLAVLVLACFFAGWPRPGTAWLRATDDALFAMVGGDAPASCASVGFIAIAATLALVLARALTARIDLSRRRHLESWGTVGLVAGVLVVVVWGNALFFAQRSWLLVGFRCPDPAWHLNPVEYIKSEMWFALRFRPWAESSISVEQWDVGAAVASIVAVAITSGVAIAREARRQSPSRWLRLLELPIVVPLFVIIGMRYLVTATVADGPDQGAWPFAVASAAVMLAFTSMILRRRRRREALS